MSDLERALRELGDELAFPATPDLAATIAARLETGVAPAPAPRLRRLALAFAVLVLALAVALVVPPARSALLEALELAGVRIERVETSPKAPAGRELSLGERVPLHEAQRAVRYRILLPLKLTRARTFVYLDRSVPGGQVSIPLREARQDSRVLLMQFQAEDGLALINKSAGPGTRIEEVSVDGEPGAWIEGAPHVFVYVGPDGRPRESTRRLAGNALVWMRGDVTLRLEGSLEKGEALRIAQMVEPVGSPRA